MKILGKQNVDYVSRKTNQQVTGVTLHVASNNNHVEGLAVETIFVSGKSAIFDKVSKIPVGAEINCLYNRYGSVEDVTVCK